MKTTTIKAIANYFGVKPGQVEDAGTEHYGLPVVSVAGEEFALAEDYNEVNGALVKAVSESVWAFSPWFLADMTGLPITIFEALQSKCEEANDAIIDIIEATCGLKKFAEEAARIDGAGHFLSTYDGHEIEVKVSPRKMAYLYKV